MWSGLTTTCVGSLVQFADICTNPSSPGCMVKCPWAKYCQLIIIKEAAEQQLKSVMGPSGSVRLWCRLVHRLCVLSQPGSWSFLASRTDEHLPTPQHRIQIQKYVWCPAHQWFCQWNRTSSLRLVYARCRKRVCVYDRSQMVGKMSTSFLVSAGFL